MPLPKWPISAALLATRCYYYIGIQSHTKLLSCPCYLACRRHRYHRLRVPAQLLFASLETQFFRMLWRVSPSLPSLFCYHSFINKPSMEAAELVDMTKAESNPSSGHNSSCYWKYCFWKSRAICLEFTSFFWNTYEMEQTGLLISSVYYRWLRQRLSYSYAL